MKNPERVELKKLKKFHLLKNEDGSYAISKTFQFYMTFTSVKSKMFESGAKQYTFYNGYTPKLVVYNGFFPKYLLRKIDKISDVENNG